MNGPVVSAADGLGRQRRERAGAVAALLVHFDGDGVAGFDGAAAGDLGDGQYVADCIWDGLDLTAPRFTLHLMLFAETSVRGLLL